MILSTREILLFISFFWDKTCDKFIYAKKIQTEPTFISTMYICEYYRSYKRNIKPMLVDLTSYKKKKYVKNRDRKFVQKSVRLFITLITRTDNLMFLFSIF